jgi:hypothetical protein
VEQTQESIERVTMGAADFGGRPARAATWHHEYRMSSFAGWPQEIEMIKHSGLATGANKEIVALQSVRQALQLLS